MVGTVIRFHRVKVAALRDEAAVLPNGIELVLDPVSRATAFLRSRVGGGRCVSRPEAETAEKTGRFDDESL
jgi:hypothetical protein